MGHVARARVLLAPTAASFDISGTLLLPPTVATDSMTSDNRCYCRTHDTHTISTSTNSSNGSSDISGLLLLPSTAAIGYMISDDRCYCWARGTHAVATSPHSSDGRSDNSVPSQMAPTVATGKRSIATGLRSSDSLATRYY
jgi:hypothetical protein